VTKWPFLSRARRLRDDVLLLLQRRVELHSVVTRPRPPGGRGLDEAILVDAAKVERLAMRPCSGLPAFDRADAAVVSSDARRAPRSRRARASGRRSRAERRRLWVTSRAGSSSWSMNCESWLDAENPDHRRHRLGIDQVVRHERLDLFRLMRSLIARSMRTRPMRYWFSSARPPRGRGGCRGGRCRRSRLPFSVDEVADDLEDVFLVRTACSSGSSMPNL